MRILKIFTLLFAVMFLGCRRDDSPERISLSKGVLNAGFISVRDTISIRDYARYGGYGLSVVGGDGWVVAQRIDDECFEIIVSTNYGTVKREAMVVLSAPGAIGEVRVYQASDSRGCPRQTIDSMALVALYNETKGADWYFEGDIKPDSRHKRWDFRKSFHTWVGVECVLVEGQYRVAILNIQGRGAVGSLPAEFDSLTMLSEFHGGANKLDVSAFKTLCKFEKMSYLDLSYNDMQGEIPVELKNLEQLMFLNISGNRWTADFPVDMRYLGQLRYLLASDCGAAFTFEHLRYNGQLQRLHLANNLVSGSVPEYISNFTKLEELDLAGNKLSGNLPGGLALLQGLKVLNLAYNKFSGRFGGQFERLQQLESLNVSGNQIVGVDAGALSSPMLKTVDFSFNSIETIDIDGSKLGSLTELLLNNNQISSIGGTFEGMRSLERVNLNANKIRELPVAIESCKKMDMIIASGCLIERVPDLSGLTLLKSLDLSGNRLSGVFPMWLTRIVGLVNLNLGANNITGPIPEAIVNVEPLRTLILKGNRMSGFIPAKVLNDKRCKGAWVTIPWEENPTESRTFFVPGVWASWQTMWPQQTDYGFLNVPQEPNIGAA